MSSAFNVFTYQSSFKSPLEVRMACRENRLEGWACRQIPGYLCTNVVCLDVAYADEFEAFCRANPNPCPLLKRFAPGQTDCDEFAKDLDIRTDLGSYDILRNGVLEQRKDLLREFSNRTVTFLIGSSTSFDGLLPMKGLKPAFGGTVQRTSIQCKPVGLFKGPMAVTVRAFDPKLTDAVSEYTSHFPQTHGGPLGKNNWQELGIPERDVNWWGERFAIPDGTDLLYWGCGVTPLFVAQQAKLPFLISYTPGHAMITDILTESMYI